ncbi:MAG: hypothetical protein ACR2L2_04360 [Acidobacteriota bacterium]
MRSFLKTSALVAALVAIASPPCAAQQAITSAGFAARALPVLPVEEPYTFHKILTEGEVRLRRDPNARPAQDEMAIPAQGWTLTIPSSAGPLLRRAAEDFRGHMKTGMQVQMELRTQDSLSDWAGLARTVVAGVRDQMPDCGGALKGRKDYQIIVSPERVAVCGLDERGAMYGLYNLEERMDLRQAPYLPRNLNTVRHSLYQARMTLSGLGWMEWPDAYLSLLSHYGFDSIFASVYVNPNGVIGPPPYWDKMRKQEPARVHDLVKRAARYGIDLYCPIIYLYTGEPENEAGLRKLVRDIVTEFPEIRGYVLLTEGFFYKNWFGAGGQGGENLREWIRNWARGVAIVSEECRKLNPSIEVLPWDYNIDFRPDQVEVKKYAISQYPLEVIPLLTFENGKSFERDGQRSSLRDYSLNEIGPAEVTAAQITAAKERGMRAVYSKADTWATWQFGTFPYLPFPYQWHARYQALETWGVDGTMESWSYGFKPNWIAEMRAWYSWSDAPALDPLLRSIARREFGAGSEAKVLKAWEHFSQAVRVVPEHGPTWGGNNGVAAPLFFQKPTKPRAMTLEHSWTDQVIWSRGSSVNPYWPFTPRQFILNPDFTNQVNAAERYARPFTLAVFQKYMRLAADEMEQGLVTYRAAALAAPASKKMSSFREVLLAEQIQRMIRSASAVLEFEDLRFRLAKTTDAAELRRLVDRMTAVLKEEIPRTEASYEAARRDSRLGYEWEQDYIYTPDILQEKLKLLRATLYQQLPAYRRQHRIQ